MITNELVDLSAEILTSPENSSAVDPLEGGWTGDNDQLVGASVRADLRQRRGPPARFGRGRLTGHPWTSRDAARGGGRRHRTAWPLARPLGFAFKEFLDFVRELLRRGVLDLNHSNLV